MTDDRYTLFDMFRAKPVESALFTALPAILATVQLINSVVTDLSYLVSVSFAVVLIGYAWLVTRYSFARFRRRRFDGLI